MIRTVLATSPPSAEYSLSELGLELLPAIEAIAEIGYRLRLERRDEMVELAGGKPQLKQ
ncbi:Transcriptional regulator, HxlR family [Pseudomonas syringae pv. lapsa]|uniref:Transcriptional regulator, HxlR family n=1 Tax=Pseudomonas syringae pv. lapsa TaxID=199201 RepID=A0AB74A410_PSESX|nr:Transcriptional regulator, HxlR family [Pseudomonas syringae pv. lapsa]RML24837.1 Transcriptional regulator, HxlR family [Pseudomonas syringae pv. lapsa]